jgi:hypothetical protein
MEISMRWLCLASYNVHFSDESEGVQTTQRCLSLAIAERLQSLILQPTNDRNRRSGFGTNAKLCISANIHYLHNDLHKKPRLRGLIDFKQRLGWCFFLRVTDAKPIKPEPNNQTDSGTGTAEATTSPM